MLNRITIMGRLGTDVELRSTTSGKSVASTVLACDRDFKNSNGEKQTDWVDVVAWGSTAEYFSKYFSKGSTAVVSGRLQMRTYTDKDGNKRKVAEILADSIYFGGSKGNEYQQTFPFEP